MGGLDSSLVHLNCISFAAISILQEPYQSWRLGAALVTRSVVVFMALTVVAILLWVFLTISAISAVAMADFSASLRTSPATTAKPRPCSPALLLQWRH